MVLIAALVFTQCILCLHHAEVTTATPSNTSDLVSTENTESTGGNLGFTETLASPATFDTFTRHSTETTESETTIHKSTKLFGTTFSGLSSSSSTDQSPSGLTRRSTETTESGTATQKSTELSGTAVNGFSSSSSTDQSPSGLTRRSTETTESGTATQKSTELSGTAVNGFSSSSSTDQSPSGLTRRSTETTESRTASHDSTELPETALNGLSSSSSTDQSPSGFTRRSTEPTESGTATHESIELPETALNGFSSSSSTDQSPSGLTRRSTETTESGTTTHDSTELPETALNGLSSSSSTDQFPSGLTEIADGESSIYESTEIATTVSTNESSSPSTTDQTTYSDETTSTTSATSTTVNSTDCTSWPKDASEDEKKIVGLEIETSTGWIALSWEAPCENAINASITYSVERCDGKQLCDCTNETDTRHNATGLDSCTPYTFVVRILTDYWVSESGVNVSATTNNTTSIDDVGDLNVHSVNENVIQLDWRAPADHANCISNYSINQCNETSCSDITVTATNYTADNLAPCIEYNFTVKTVTPTVVSDGVTRSARTISPKLSEPTNCTIEPGNFSLTVTWEPVEPKNCLKHYRVSVDKFVRNITETRVVVPNLHACMDYEVSISAVNKDDVPGNTYAENATTLKYRTDPPNLVPPCVQTYETKLTTYWSIEKENNHCELNYLTVTCNNTGAPGRRLCQFSNTSQKMIDREIAADNVIMENVTVSGLSPFTNYTCTAYTMNIGGQSNLSVVTARTLEDVPDPPSSLALCDVTDSQFSLSWEEPECPRGNLQEFRVKITWEKRYPVPSWCAEEKSGVEHDSIDGSTFNYDYRNVTAFTRYEARVKARTGAETKDGWGSYSESKYLTTDPKTPEAVTKFDSSSIIFKPNPGDPNVLDTILTWGLPCSLRGELEFFEMSVHGTRDKLKPDFFSVRHKCKEHVNDCMCSLNLNRELRGEYNYSFAVSAKVKDVDALGEPTEVKNIQHPAGIPPRPDESYIQKITVDPYKMPRSTTSAAVLLPMFTDENGVIRYYAVMVSKMGSADAPASTRFDLKRETWPNTSSWEQAAASDFSITYQATMKNWDPSDHIVPHGDVKAITYTIGEDATCGSTKRRYCNGPLKPDTWYQVRMRAFTYGGYADSDFFAIKTNAELNVGLVIGAVFGILCTGIVVTMMLLVRKCSPYLVLRRFLHSDMPGSPVPAPFTRKKFISHCQQLIDNPGKLSNEFRLLQTLSVDLQMPTNTACLQANRKKNRYSDILPYDFSRVKLEVIDNDPNTDYINASFIKGYTGEDEYIACQGPKEETTYDFWRMVDQYNINIIVMLTQLVEKGKEKCHQYYPAIRETFRYENMTIRCTSELDFRTHTQRTLVLQKEKEKRSITHLHFKDWPDHDVPDDFDAMINFCQIMRRNITANKGFIVVHCSAGIGRTGTLIAIDILLQHLRDNRKLDVFGTVYRLRHHRINMVQRESQYAYIYNCIKQVLKNPYFLKTYKPPSVEPIYENVPKKAKDATNSDINLVNNLELSPTKYNRFTSMESLTVESIYNLFSWSKPQRTSSGLRHYKSMSAICTTTHPITAETFQTLDCVCPTHFSKNRVFTESSKASSSKSSRESLIQEHIPLITSNRSPDTLEGSTQCATSGKELLKSTEHTATRIFNDTTSV